MALVTARAADGRITFDRHRTGAPLPADQEWLLGLLNEAGGLAVRLFEDLGGEVVQQDAAQGHVRARNAKQAANAKLAITPSPTEARH